MSEAEIDALVARLVPEFEVARQAASAAREHYLAQAAVAGASSAAVLKAHWRWQRLESACHAVLRRIDDLAESTAA